MSEPVPPPVPPPPPGTPVPPPVDETKEAYEQAKFDDQLFILALAFPCLLECLFSMVRFCVLYAVDTLMSPFSGVLGQTVSRGIGLYVLSLLFLRLLFIVPRWLGAREAFQESVDAGWRFIAVVSGFRLFSAMFLLLFASVRLGLGLLITKLIPMDPAEKEAQMLAIYRNFSDQIARLFG